MKHLGLTPTQEACLYVLIAVGLVIKAFGFTLFDRKDR